VPCITLEKRTRDAAQELGIEAQIEKVTDMRQIMQYPILSTPGLVINEKMVSSGRLPSKDEIKELIATAKG
jgi:small redox-active disulfide protein 2